MKKLSMLLCMLLLLGFMTGFGAETPARAEAPDPAETEEPEIFFFGDYAYVIREDGTAKILYYTGSGKTEDLAIPAVLQDLDVTAIGNRAFQSVYGLHSVSIPDSVTDVGNNPFAGCRELESIAVSPENPGLAVMDGVLFRKADKCLICYPAGLKAESYEIPQGIAAIGDEAFSACFSLHSVSIPDSVTVVGKNPFVDCLRLETIALSDENPALAVTDGVLFDMEDMRLICYPAGLFASSYEIPQGVAAVGDGAFSNCFGLVSVSIPESVASIANQAFFSCGDLREVKLSEGLTEIGVQAFSFCGSLNSITLPESVTAIGIRAFEQCGKLSGIHIPEGVVSIGERAFKGCGVLSGVELPASITAMGEAVFEDCGNLKNVVTARDSYAAEYCRENGLPYTYPDANSWLNG